MQFTLVNQINITGIKDSTVKLSSFRKIIKLTRNLLNCALSQYALIQMGAEAAGEWEKKQTKPCNTTGTTELEHCRRVSSQECVKA